MTKTIRCRCSHVSSSSSIPAASTTVSCHVGRIPVIIQLENFAFGTPPVKTVAAVEPRRAELRTEVPSGKPIGTITNPRERRDRHCGSLFAENNGNVVVESNRRQYITRNVEYPILAVLQLIRFKGGCTFILLGINENSQIFLSG
jgi:hypothetical protein